MDGPALDQLVAAALSASPAARLELIWRAFEDATGRLLERPPTMPEGNAVRGWLRELRGASDAPAFLTKVGTLRHLASFDLAEKASHMAQLPCGACETVVGAEGRTALSMTFPIDVEPWSAQSEPERRLIKQLVSDELKERGFPEPVAYPLCLSIVSLLPIAKRAVWTKDVDNLVKGLIDAMKGVLFLDDRTVQCLTSRRVEYGGDVGCYFVQIRAVYPWTADVVHDGGDPPRIASGRRIRRP